MSHQEDPLHRPEREWKLTNRSMQETRTYIQSELTIDGEAQLFLLVTDVVAALQKGGFPFERMKDLFPDTDDLSSIDLGIVSEMLTVVAAQAADLLTRTACVLLSIFPTDEHQQRNTRFDDEYKFLRGALKMADVVEMAETFTQQNDVERLARPFWKGWAKLTEPIETAAFLRTRSTTSSSLDTGPLSTSPDTTRGESSGER